MDTASQKRNAHLKIKRRASRSLGGGWAQRTLGQPLPQWAREAGIHNWVPFALEWIISHPAVTCTIPGTAKVRHMLDNMPAGRGAMLGQAMRKRMQELVLSL